MNAASSRVVAAEWLLIILRQSLLMAEILDRRNISSTSASNCSSIGSATHLAQLRIFSGLALPAMVVVMSGLAVENCSASLAMSLPRLAQSAAALRAAAFTASGSFSHLGSGALVSKRALNGPALRMPMPLALR